MSYDNHFDAKRADTEYAVINWTNLRIEVSAENRVWEFNPDTHSGPFASIQVHPAQRADYMVRKRGRFLVKWPVARGRALFELSKKLGSVRAAWRQLGGTGATSQFRVREEENRQKGMLREKLLDQHSIDIPDAVFNATALDTLRTWMRRPETYWDTVMVDTDSLMKDVEKEEVDIMVVKAKKERAKEERRELWAQGKSLNLQVPRNIKTEDLREQVEQELARRAGSMADAMSASPEKVGANTGA